MSLVTAIRDMIVRGMTVEQALLAAEVMEASLTGPKSNAQRQAEWRARQKAKRNGNNESNENNENVTFVTASREIENAPTHAEPEPNITTYPTTSEANASSVEPQPAELPLTGELILPSPSPAPVRAKSRASPEKRGSRLPSDWEPDEDDWQIARNEGIPDDRIPRTAGEFRDYWSDVPGDRGRKLSWKGTWRNHCRRVADRIGGSRQAYPPGNQRSDGSLLAAHLRAAARSKAQNDVSRQRPGVFDYRERELEMHYGIPAE